MNSIFVNPNPNGICMHTHSARTLTQAVFECEDVAQIANIQARISSDVLNTHWHNDTRSARRTRWNKHQAKHMHNGANTRVIHTRKIYIK